MWNRIVFAGADIPFEPQTEVGLDQVEALEEEIEAQHELEVEEGTLVAYIQLVRFSYSSYIARSG